MNLRIKLLYYHKITKWYEFEMTEYKVVGKVKGLTEEAIRILFRCPKCKEEIITDWLFPDTPMVFTTNCCEEEVFFEPKE